MRWMLVLVLLAGCDSNDAPSCVGRAEGEGCCLGVEYLHDACAPGLTCLQLALNRVEGVCLRPCGGDAGACSNNQCTDVSGVGERGCFCAVSAVSPGDADGGTCIP